MKYFVGFFLIFLLSASPLTTYAGKHKRSTMPSTEVDLMNGVLNCLRYKDSVSYYSLFPPFDTLWHMVLHNTDRSPEVIKELDHLKENPQSLIDFDPFYNHGIMARFGYVLQKGEDSGIHWNSIVMQRYELSKEGLTQNLVGYERIAPERFSGYMFVRDLMGRTTYCITITEIQKINGHFFGGQVLNILEASTLDEFKNRSYEEQKYFNKLAHDAIKDTAKKDSDAISDSLKVVAAPKVQVVTDTATDTSAKNNLAVTNNSTDDEKPKTRKEVIYRKYYEGKFDDEIPVKMFIRYMKDPATGKISFWDGLYKFGDQTVYAKLNITRNAAGTWLIEDEPPVGSMELELKNKIYTGSWSSNENGSGYDVVMTEVDVPSSKIEELDNILEKGQFGGVNQETKPEKPVKKNEDEGFDPNQQ